MSPDMAIMITLCTGILTLGGVLVLRPIATRLGGFLDAVTQARLRPQPEHDMAQIRDLLSSIDLRLNQIEERQDFAEALISAGGDPKLMSVPVAMRAQERN